MVVTQKVAQAMGDQSEDLGLQGVRRLALRLLHRDHDIPEDLRLAWRRLLVGREGQDIGRLVLVAIASVERPNLDVVAE